MSTEHEFQNGCKVRAMYDGFGKMYKRGDVGGSHEHRGFDGH